MALGQQIVVRQLELSIFLLRGLVLHTVEGVHFSHGRALATVHALLLARVLREPLLTASLLFIARL